MVARLIYSNHDQRSHDRARSASRSQPATTRPTLISWNWVNTFRRHGLLRNGPLPLLCATIAVSRSRMCFSRRGQVGTQSPSPSRKTRRERLRRISPSCRSYLQRKKLQIDAKLNDKAILIPRNVTAALFGIKGGRPSEAASQSKCPVSPSPKTPQRDPRILSPIVCMQGPIR
jgi:hypothetical protein